MAIPNDQSGTTPAAITINPATNDLTLDSADVLDESINVTIRKGNKCNNVRLVSAASIARLIDSIDPPGGFGPFKGEQDQTLTFHVRFHGIPCTPEPQVLTGTIDVLCDEMVIAKKEVKITVPACAPTAFVYSVKFICGEHRACGCECAFVQQGRYATEISIHNYGIKEVAILERFIPVVLAGAPAGREPKLAAPRAEEKIVLPPQTATMDDCCRIAELLFGHDAELPMPITIGFLEITANGPLAVTAVYTTTGLDSTGVSIEVEQIATRRA